jgi:hypothetical protein
MYLAGMTLLSSPVINVRISLEPNIEVIDTTAHNGHLQTTFMLTRLRPRTAQPAQSWSRGLLKLPGFQQLLHCLLDACMPLLRSLRCTVPQTIIHKPRMSLQCMHVGEVQPDSRRSLLWISSSAMGSDDTARRWSCCRDMTRTARSLLVLSK